ncbi:MAG: DUF2852 domain-containing protein [Pseudomonadota bacterium]|nr:DUF2852 domain-containing protein [Pseudomonadota bacterium]
MSNTQGAYDNASSPWTRGCAGSRWTPVELIAMVLGFMVFWPIGLAILGFKYWQRKTGGADLQTVATGAFRNARSAMGGFQTAAPRNWGQQNWARGFTASTGNAAFDEWKSAELARLEAERRRLEDAHREFADWLDNVRKAKDREEFERFMSERRGKGA